jgi:hypothetical protein
VSRALVCAATLTFATAGLAEGSALAELRADARGGDPQAQYDLAERYWAGDGVPKSQVTAARWLQRAADQGHADAQSDVGQLYHYGVERPIDYHEAVAWYRRAAAQGNARGQNSLGIMYRAGLGVRYDDAEAVVWFERAAAQGNADAQNNLGTMYLGGLGVEADEQLAREWYQKAADQAHADARLNLEILDARARSGDAPGIFDGTIQLIVTDTEDGAQMVEVEITVLGKRRRKLRVRATGSEGSIGGVTDGAGVVRLSLPPNAALRLIIEGREIGDMTVPPTGHRARVALRWPPLFVVRVAPKAPNLAGGPDDLDRPLAEHEFRIEPLDPDLQRTLRTDARGDLRIDWLLPDDRFQMVYVPPDGAPEVRLPELFRVAAGGEAEVRFDPSPSPEP